MLGERAKLVLVDGGGHAIFGLAHNVCANETAASFLANGVLPSSDMTCPANPPQLMRESAPSPSRVEVIKAAIREMTPLLR